MVTTTLNRDEAMQRLRAQVDALPDDSPRRALLMEILAGDSSASAREAQREALRRAAWERYDSLPDADPLKAVLGRLLHDGKPAPAGNDGDGWSTLEALRQRQEALFKGLQTVDARSAAAMAEAQRLAAQAVEMQQFLNMVLEEVNNNTAMLKSLHETLQKP